MPLGNTMLIANFVVWPEKAIGPIRQKKPQEPICKGPRHGPVIG